MPVRDAVHGMPAVGHHRPADARGGTQRAQAVRLRSHPHRYESGVRR